VDLGHEGSAALTTLSAAAETRSDAHLKKALS
jgi:hypothetical protein